MRRLLLHLFKDTNLKKGFSFIELAVVLSIFAIMSSVVMFNFQEYSRKIQHTNAGYLIALEFKTAQSLGISAAGDNSLISGAQQTATVAFDFDSVADVFTGGFIVFRENTQSLQGGGLSQKGVYEQTDVRSNDRQSQLVTEKIKTIHVCVGGAPGVGSCDRIAGHVGVSFVRPDPEPIITADDPSCTINLNGYKNAQCVGSLYVEISNIRDPGFTSFVVVEPSGLIRVAN